MNTNPELELAQRLIEKTGTSIFLTGKAGTGKTTFLRNLMNKLPKRMVVLAPTGIAAINAGGMTIHSFFQLPLAPFVPGMAFKGDVKYKYRFSKEKINIIRSLDLLVIDEISMVRADLLDAIDDVMRRYKDRNKPFGGVQLLLIGDIQQLPPVVTDKDKELLEKYYESPYFFSSLALKQTDMVTIELTKVYRQNDGEFLELLNAIRENRCDSRVLDRLNSRFVPGFDPDAQEGYIRLTTHNYLAQQINEQKLNLLPGEIEVYRAKVTGDFPEMSYPTDTELLLRVGARVMFIKNDVSGMHRYANGSLGKVIELNANGIKVRIDATDEVVDVQKEIWTNAKYKLNDETKEIEEEVEGEFMQYPLKLAWAITVHKSQGLTFDKAVIDVSGAFAHGQTYVALSRCRTLEGIVLSARVPARALISDEVVDHFIKESNGRIPDGGKCELMQKAYFIDLLSELFGFKKLKAEIEVYVRMLDEYFYETYPILLNSYKEELRRMNRELIAVGEKFKQQYSRMVEVTDHYDKDKMLQERIHSAAEYFFNSMQPLLNLQGMPHPDADSKKVEKKFGMAADNMCADITTKLNLMAYVRDEGFEVSGYLRKKAVMNIREEVKKKKKTGLGEMMTGRINGGRKSVHDGHSLSGELSTGRSSVGDVKNVALYNALKKWRQVRAQELNQPVYMVLQQKALIGVANRLPHSMAQLKDIPYIGKVTMEKYGEEIMEIVEKYDIEEPRLL